MPRRGENIYKRKDGRWEGDILEIMIYLEKHDTGYLYAKTYMEVKSKLHTVISEKTNTRT